MFKEQNRRRPFYRAYLPENVDRPNSIYNNIVVFNDFSSFQEDNTI